MKLIDKDTLLAEINKRITDAPVNYIGHQRVWAYNDVKDIIDTIEVKEVKEPANAFIEKSWDWIEDNLLSSNQQEKSSLYFEQFKNYVVGE